VVATGYPAPTFSETGALPSGVTLNSTTGVLSGTAAAGSSGSYPITITASNGISPAATQNFTLTVNQAPAITSGSSATFAVGTAGTFTVVATGYPAPTFSQTGTLPSGVTLNSTTGVLSGTPAAGTGGSYPITITASNGISPNATQNFTLTVNQPIVVTLSPRGTTNLDAGATLPISVTVANDPNNQGANFSLNPTTGCGTLSGGTSNVFSVTYNAPTSLSSQCQVTLTAAAYSNNNQTDQLTITVYPPLSVPSTTLPSVYVGQSYTGGSVNLQGGVPPYTWNGSVASGSLPAGLSLSNLNGGTLQITGTPTTPSGCSTYPPSCTSTFTVKVTDGTGAVATSPTLSITVNQVQPLTLPTSQPSLPSSAIVNGSYSGAIKCFGWGPALHLYG